MKELLERINQKFDHLIELYSGEEVRKGIEIAKEAINIEIIIYNRENNEMLIKESEILIKEAEKILEKYSPKRRDN